MNDYFEHWQSIGLPEDFDEKQLAEVFEEDFEGFLMMLEMFETDIYPSFQQMEEEVEKGNFQAVKSRAHQLKPTFSMLGLMDLHKSSLQLEKAAEMQSSGEIEKYFSVLKTGIQEVQPEIRKAINLLS